MAAVTAASLNSLDFSVMDSAPSNVAQGMASTTSFPASKAPSVSARRPSRGKPSRLPQAKCVQRQQHADAVPVQGPGGLRSTRRLSSPNSDLIPPRLESPRMGSGMDSATQFSDCSSMATHSSITPSQSASQARARASRNEATRNSSDEAIEVLEDIDSRQVGPSRHVAKAAPVTLHALRNLEIASLSTPELHLASDPMLDTEEPSFLRGPRKTQSRGGFQPESNATRPEASRQLPHGSEPAIAAFSSFSSAMDVFDEDGDIRGMMPLEIGDEVDPQDALGSGLWQNGNMSTDTLNARTARKGGQAGQAMANAGSWFKRPRRWSANATGNYATSATSAATAGSGTTFFTESIATGATGLTRSTLGVDDRVHGSKAFMDSLRSARAFLVQELGRLPSEELGEIEASLANLARQPFQDRESAATEPRPEPSREMHQFWQSVSDGILLCILLNRLCPGSVERIDRRDLDWVKADNISRFLRAARDQLGLKSKDLCQTLDLTDATVEGLQRAVHTILAVEKAAHSRSRGARRSGDFMFEHKNTSMTRLTPPATPRESFADQSTPTEKSFSSSPGSSPKSLNETPKQVLSAIQQHRKETERILVSMARTDTHGADANGRPRRRMSNELGASVLGTTKPKGASITFADSVKGSGASDEESRMPYWDRKLSESAISLTGVAEEEAEDELDSSRTPRRGRAPSSPNPEPFRVRRGSSSESETSTSPMLGTSATGSPLARVPSQRRISAELGLGNVPRGAWGSAENLNDLSFLYNGSPVRQAPTRRHSARGGMATPSLNPSRDSLVSISTLGGQSAPEAEGGSPATPRVPFPRSSVVHSESPSAKRIGRHLSLNTGPSADSIAGLGVSSSSSGMVSASPKLGNARPMYRHMRYSSDLHLPQSQRSSGGPPGRSPDLSLADLSVLSSSRARFESDVGSLYTNTLGSTTHDEGSIVTRLSREPSVHPSSKHKLVVVEEGKPNVTYQLGNCIGRGQFGSVYRALNLNTGQMVAVKRIKLEGRPDDDVTQLMNEVDLLKSLVHPSVVKYEGLVRGPDVVSIILEYVENGSLLHTLKAFGNFPEKLVASYVVKILEGLNYLHEQNVVHCDLKAANILTTKNGNVKLSDFGVSLNLKAVEKINNKNDAIGTPNWMAPEVIELKGASTAADIWSLGCTIIELLTGKPPYGDMLAMSAMFRIVEDACPPLPERCSESLRDLLLQCFHKDPTKRPSAEMLFEHEWVRQTWTGHKELRPQDSVPFLRRISADLRKLDPNLFISAKPNQGLMERSSSSPPASLSRPDLVTLRASSSPATNGQVAPPFGISPPASPPMATITIPGMDDLLFDRTGSDPMSGLILSPEQAPSPHERGMSPLQNPSLLDLNGSGIEEAKPHAFVKSTFSKAVQCKICREPVKKHAVLCEECGLVCHARCAGLAPSSCSLRAQLLMFQHRASVEQSRGASPAPQPAAVGAASATSLVLSSSPVTSPSSTSFKLLPFAMSRRLSKTPSVEQAAVEFANGVAVGSPPQTPTGIPTTGIPGKKEGDAKTSAPRKRRISLRPRPRSPSPEPPVRTASMNSSISVLPHTTQRRGSSLSYGSMSGSSSISSGGGAAMFKSSSGESAGHQHHHQHHHQQRQHLQGHHNAISTPQLVMPISPSVDSGMMEQGRFRRRISSGFPFGHSEVSLNIKAGGRSVSHKVNAGAAQEKSNVHLSNGQITPRPGQNTERRKHKRSSTAKVDCVIM
ncbi:Pkinase-domain-containing protein [Violaceomyces palustris]|uniref:Pkinase-domain-containing protein n=1 Tax=Violaceomyces palustris TaxID=1673888 RepID=A0ACD0NM21_9BASI|nr:Pkinase-domain-containing protein [Violaceomyces palustris]